MAASRSLRRHHAKRIKARTRAMGIRILRMPKSSPDGEDLETLDRWTNRTWQHRKACSCDMCANPRRSRLSKGGQRTTMAERRAILRAEDA